ncbi:hypothetical protein [Aliikangiella sp. IMCC44632]
MATSGCSGDSDFVGFEGLKIPQEYVLHAPSEGVKGVFDDEDINIALVVSEDEIKSVIPQYQIANRGGRDLSFVLKNGLIDLSAVSVSVLTGFTNSDAQVDADKYLPYERLYRSSYSWLLVSSEGEGKFLEGQCNRAGLKGDVEACYFKKNINGYGVSFHLEDNNIALVKDFENFISDKIESWRN